MHKSGETQGKWVERVIASELDLEAAHTIKVEVASSGKIVRLDAFRSGTDTSGGQATAILTAEPVTATATATIYGTALGSSIVATTTVQFVVGMPWIITATANPPKITADGVSTSTIAAEVVDHAGLKVPDHTVVTFTTSAGSLGSSQVTKGTVNGVATAALTSTTTTGTATITATSDSKFDTITVTFVAGPPYTVTATAVPTTTHCGLTSTITATVEDKHKNPVVNGTVVTFSTSLGSLGSSKITKYTSGGIATATLTSDISGTATITVTSDSISDTASVTFWVGPPYTVAVEAHPTRIFADGVSTSAITATVRDAYDYPVLNGTVVTFTTSLGSLGSSTVTKTTSSGVATATLTSITTTGTATIIATSDSKFDTCTVEFASVYRIYLPFIMKNYP